MGATDLNLVFDVSFNRNVALSSALYWQQETLTDVMTQAEKMSLSEIEALAVAARGIIAEKYTWSGIVAQYERLFLNEG